VPDERRDVEKDLAGESPDAPAQALAQQVVAMTPVERLRLLDQLCRDLTRLAVGAERVR
jgi:hypothetical protein